MRFLLTLLICSPLASCKAQNSKIIIDTQQIDDLTEYPIYSRLVDENGSWKPEFQYLDSIEIFTITYLSDGLQVKGLIAKPKKEGKYPCIIYNRGGNRDFGALTVAHGAITLGQLAKQGYVVIASQYRGNSGGQGIEEFGGSDVNDVIILTEALNEITSADTERIGMYGWSRGGMMTFIALTKTDKIRAAIVGGAVSDQFSSIEDRPEMETMVLSELIPNYKESKEIELMKRSAIRWVDKLPKNVPILMLHGNADWRVKPEQSLKLALEFEKERIPYRLIIFEGGDHGISEHKQEVKSQVIDWFDKYLKRDEPLPNMEYHGK
ncbi:MAG: prolyl oligopeptidase family serine peptidase [Balneolaceae bacterium]